MSGLCKAAATEKLSLQEEMSLHVLFAVTSTTKPEAYVGSYARELSIHFCPEIRWKCKGDQ